MDLWKNKVAAKFKLLLGGKKAALEANKHLDESKEEFSKELEEKREELKPKVVGIYEASSTEIKTLIKEPTVPGFKKHSTKVQKFLDELVTIGFPGSKAVSEASSKYGPVLVSGSVTFVFEKVSTFIVTDEEKPALTTSREVEIPLPETEATPVTATVPTTEVPPPVIVAATTVVPEVEKEKKVEETKVEILEKAVVVELEKAAETATKEVLPKVEAGKPEEAPKAK